MSFGAMGGRAGTGELCKGGRWSTGPFVTLDVVEELVVVGVVGVFVVVGVVVEDES